MKLQEFLEQNVGQWIAQRTNYHVDQDRFENSKTEITVELLCPDSSEIDALYQNQLEPSQILGVMKSSWNVSLDKPQTNSVILVFADHDDEQARLFYQLGSDRVTGRYFWGQDDALTLSVRADNTTFEERLWFASPNLRLRTSLRRQDNDISTTAFYSEIRKLPPKST